MKKNNFSFIVVRKLRITFDKFQNEVIITEPRFHTVTFNIHVSAAAGFDPRW